MAWIRCTGNTGGSLKVRTASGAIASFETNLAEPLQSVKCEINATGGNGTPDNPNPINGYTEANITRCGVNLCFDAYGNKASENTYLYPSGDNLPIIVNNTLRTAYAYVGKNADVVISFADVPQRSIAYGLEGYPELGTICHALTVTALTTKSFKVNSGNYEYIAFYYCNDLANIPSDCQIEKGSTASTYEAYNGNTYAIAFGQTVYGGVLDVTRGKLHVTHAKSTIIGENITEVSGYNNVHFFAYKIPDDGLSSLTKTGRFSVFPNAQYCYPFDSADNIGKVANNAQNNRFWFGFSTDTTLAQAQIVLNGTDMLYELETPFDIDLTPVQIEQLLGKNNVWHDANGDTEVKFLEVVRN